MTKENKIKIVQTLLEVGMLPNNNGFYDLIYCVNYAMIHPNYVATTELYPSVAKELNTTDIAVLRNIRFAIRKSFQNPQCKKNLEKLIGCEIMFRKNLPTSGELIDIIATYLNGFEHII